MARLALISDIHANLEAFAAALEDIASCDVDRLVCLGDVVGYGPDPARCVDLAVERCDVIILGNHDEAVINSEVARTFNPHARCSIDYARRMLDERGCAEIERWARRARLDGVDLTHGSFGPDSYEYVQRRSSVMNAFQGMESDLGGVGHTHLPSVFSKPALSDDPEHLCAQRMIPRVGVDLAPGCAHIVNPGSVGQPRDANPDASWGLLDTESRTFRMRRVAYDIDLVEWKMRQAGLPALLHERLRIGA